MDKTKGAYFRERHQILLTVLPRERRARHPYQLATMIALVLFSVSQLTMGPVPMAYIASLPFATQNQLNWFALVGGLTGIAAALIPERVVKIFSMWLDATWIRLCVELACQGLLSTVWFSYFATVTSQVPIRYGLTFSGGVSLCLGVAAATRFIQIVWTIKRAIIDPPINSAVVGSNLLDGQSKGG